MKVEINIVNKQLETNEQSAATISVLNDLRSVYN